MRNIPLKNVPVELMKCMMATEQYLAKQLSVDNSFMSLLRYYVSDLNGCQYCIAMHRNEALLAGQTEQRIKAITQKEARDIFTSLEQLLIEWAEWVTALELPEHTNQDLYQQLNRYLSQNEIACFTMAVVQINSWNRLSKSFGFDPKLDQPN